MSSSVHFRFKSARDLESLSFEGDFLKVADLKVAIVERKKLNFGEGFDLEISDAATGDVFHDENSLVQKNTSVIVRRVPGLKPGGILSHQDMAGKNERYAEKDSSNATNLNPSPDQPTPNLPQTIEGADEADRIASLIDQSAATFENFPPPPRGRYGNRGGYRGGRGNGYGGGRGAGAGASYGGANPGGAHPDRAPRPSQNYVCHRCNKPGHWIDQCPTNGDPTYDKIKVRAPTGIPRSMLRQVDAPESGTGLQDSSGHFVTLQPNEEEFARQTVGLRLSQAAAAAAMGKEIDPKMDPVEKPALDASGADVVPATITANGIGAEDNDGKDASALAQQSNPLEPSPDAPGTIEEAAKNPGNSPPNAINESTNAQGKPASANLKPSTTSGFRASGGRGNGRHVNKPNSVTRAGITKTPAGLPIPGMPPMPGVPPMGMAPFPPGMPPPPPHILMAMAAASGQNGLPPLPPNMLPNVPMPFANGLNQSERDGLVPDLPGGQQPGFQHFMAMMQAHHANAIAGSDTTAPNPDQTERNGSAGSRRVETKKSEESRASPEAGSLQQRSANVTNSREGSVAQVGDVPIPERGSEADRSLDQLNRENVDSQHNSRSASPQPRPLSDVRGERHDDGREPKFNGIDRPSYHDQRNMQLPRHSRRSQSRFQSPSRRRSISPGIQSPDRGYCYSPSRRRDRGRAEGPPFRPDFQTPVEAHAGMDSRLARGDRGFPAGSAGYSPPSGRLQARNRSPKRLPHGAPDRRRSRSPPMRGRRGRSPRRSPDRYSRRSRSPGARRRRHDSPAGVISGRSPKRRREQWQSPSPPPAGRYGKGSSRFRSRSPPEPTRYNGMHRDRDLSPRARLRDRPRSSRSPTRLGGRLEDTNGFDTSLRERDRAPPPDSRYDTRRSRVANRPSDIGGGSRAGGSDMDGSRPPVGEERADRKLGEFETPRELSDRRYDMSRRSGPDDELNDRNAREDRVRAERRLRRERDRDGRPTDDPHHSKRSRRGRSAERENLDRRDRRDRRSVHDRLGQPQRERKRGQRRSVHDRLG